MARMMNYNYTPQQQQQQQHIAPFFHPYRTPALCQQQSQKQAFLNTCPYCNERTYCDGDGCCWFIETLKKTTGGSLLEVDRSISLLNRIGILQPFDQFQQESFLIRIRKIAWLIVCRDRRLPWTWTLRMSSPLEATYLWNLLKALVEQSPPSTLPYSHMSVLGEDVTKLIYPWTQMLFYFDFDNDTSNNQNNAMCFVRQKEHFQLTNNTGQQQTNKKADNSSVLYNTIVQAVGPDLVYEALVTLTQVGFLRPLDQFSSPVLDKRFEYFAMQYASNKNGLPLCLFEGLSKVQKHWVHLILTHYYNHNIQTIMGTTIRNNHQKKQQAMKSIALPKPTTTTFTANQKRRLRPPRNKKKTKKPAAPFKIEVISDSEQSSSSGEEKISIKRVGWNDFLRFQVSSSDSDSEDSDS